MQSHNQSYFKVKPFSSFKTEAVKQSERSDSLYDEVLVQLSEEAVRTKINQQRRDHKNEI